MKKSSIALVLSVLFISSASFLYFPKWKKNMAEATIGWDVAGYYLYLPAIFIYKDLKQFSFYPKIVEKYHPTPDFQQAFKHESGNYVLHYTSGQAIQYLPFFTIAHIIASNSDKYEADGYSRPYQLLITIGSLLTALLGLFFLRKVLLTYFDDTIVAIVLIGIVFGSNYLDYTAFNGAMTHNGLFTLYAMLLFVTVRFYENPTYKKAIIIGGIVGMLTLTRPTEMLSFIIPILWGVNVFSKKSIMKRFNLLKDNYPKLLLAVAITILIGSIQLLYWKYTSGEWIVYSYENQGFTWLHPHLEDGFFSFRAGWLVYTPMMIFALVGFYPLCKTKLSIWGASFVFSSIFIYIAFAWDIWWYGGSLGQRSMIQAYPVLAFPFASFVGYILKNKKVVKIAFFLLFGLFVYANLWYTHQAHKGGMLYAGYMTKPYFLRTFGTYKKLQSDTKLLDTDEDFRGVRKDVKLLYQNSFEHDTVTNRCAIEPIEGNRSVCVSKDYQLSPIYFVDIKPNDAEWIRATAVFRSKQKEWDTWRMAQFVVRFYDGEKIVKERIIRLFRFLADNDTKELFIDVSFPAENFDKVGVLLYNAESDKEMVFDNLRIESFNE